MLTSTLNEGLPGYGQSVTAPLWLNDPFVVACLVIVCVVAAVVVILILALAIKREAQEASHSESEPATLTARHRP
jgi:hypothetical protein